ncbi:MAG: SxtJ family membrane protein [Phycisphaerales bacterium]
MPLIDIKLNPTRTELRVFAVLWLVFFFVLGRMAMWKPGALLVAAAVTGTAWLISLAFNRDFPRRVQVMGGLIPLGLLTIGGVEQLGVRPEIVEYTLWGVGLLGAAMSLASASVARRLYTGWMRAAVPLGWTFSHVILGAIYYALFTPIGLLMRLRGYDPMERRWEKGRASYWIERSGTPETARYFRQF